MMSRTDVIGFLSYCLAYYLTAAVAVVIGYHRSLSHGALRLRKWFERLLITAGLPAGTPIQWAGNHRFHHAHADEEVDPHSPVVRGFWFSHCGWYINSSNPLVCLLYALAGPLRIIVDGWIRPRTNRQYDHLAPDVARDPYYRFLSRPLPYLTAMLAHAGIAFGIAFWAWGWVGLAALWATLVFIYNCGDAIDSVAHLYGDRTHPQKNGSRNGWVMALLTFGDGWHSDHHRFPASARVGLRRGQFDMAWLVISVLRFLRLAYDIRVAEQAGVERISVAADISLRPWS